MSRNYPRPSIQQLTELSAAWIARHFAYECSDKDGLRTHVEDIMFAEGAVWDCLELPIISEREARDLFMSRLYGRCGIPVVEEHFRPFVGVNADEIARFDDVLFGGPAKDFGDIPVRRRS